MYGVNIHAQTIACVNDTYISLDENGELEVLPEMILFGGPYDYEVMEVVPSQFTCADIGSHTVSVTDTEADISCWATVNIEDKLPPVAICEQNSIIELPEEETGMYSLNLMAIDLASDSWDNCTANGALRYTFTTENPANDPNFDTAINSSSQLLVYNEEDGKYFQETVQAYIWDESGNWNACIVDINIVLGPCEDFNWDIDVSTPLESITVSEFNVAANDLSPDYLAAETDFQYNEVYPASSVCFPNDLSVSWVDSVTYLTNGSYLIERKFTVVNWVIEETRMFEQAITNTNTPALFCNESVTISLDPLGESILSPDMFLEGNQDVQDLSLNLFTANCDDIENSPLSIEVSGMLGNESVTCTSLLTVEDKTPPIPIAHQNNTLVLGQNGEASLFAEDLNNNSYDGCSGFDLSFTLSQYTFNISHLGDNTVFLNVCDEYNNCNSTWTNVKVVNGSTSLACNDHINVSVDNAGEVHLTPDVGLEGGPYDYDLMTITPSFLDCSNIGEEITYTVTDTVNETSCWGTLFVEDKLAPIVIVNNNVVLMLVEGQNGEAPMGRIYAEQIDNGSFDNCTAQEDLLFEPDFYEFNCSDVGTQTISLTVTDESGNSASTTLSVIVEANDGSVTEITCPADIVVDCGINLDDENIINNLLGNPSFDNDQVCVAYSYQNVNGFDQNNDGDLEDSFIIDGTTISENYKLECGYGTIARQWISSNGLGCTQLIYVKASDDLFDGDSMIDWPYSEDYFIDIDQNDGQISCNTPGGSSSVSIVSVDENQAMVNIDCIDDICELPVWLEQDCELIGYNIASDTLLFGVEFCAQITNTYTVINWCEYNEATGAGVWTYQVVANFTDTSDPAVQVEDAEISLVCDGQSSLGMYILPDAEACVNADYRLEIFVDYFSDNSIDLEWSSWSPVDLGVASSPLWDDDDGNGIPDVSVGNIGGVDNASSNTVPNDFLYTITLPDDAPITTGDEQHQVIWKVFDFCGNLVSDSNMFTIQGDLDDDIDPIPFCINNSTAIMQEDEEGNVDLTLYAIDFNFGSYDNCTASENLRFTFTDTPPAEDSLYINTERTSSIVIEYPGAGVETITVNLDIYVWDENGNYDYCVAQVHITIGDCLDFSWEEDVFFPLELIEITALGVSPDSLTPEQLMENHGFTLAEVEPTYTECWETNMFSTYSDIVFEIGNGAYKILRTWVILNWLEAETYEYSQIIKNYNEFDFICDFLPRSADVIDCDFGHTLADDVEWPNDLDILDHRITPSELIEFSDVDPLDAEPSFYNTSEQYVASYVDLLGTISPDALVILRQWTASRMDFPGLEWEYEQQITIDLTQFAPVVSTQTIGLRPIPNVELAENISTDEFGLAQFDETTTYNPVKEDVSHNGITVKDIVLLGNHILGNAGLSSAQELAADISGDTELSSFDLVLMRKALTGVEEIYSTEWIFSEISSGIINDGTNSIQYLGIKPGDLDDDAYLVEFEKEDPVMEISMTDIVLNAGQTYEIDITVDQSVITSGFQASYFMDKDLVTIVDVTAPVFNDPIMNFFVNDSNELTMVATNLDYNKVTIEDGEAIFTLSLFANQNTTLNEVFAETDTRNSYILDEEYTLLALGTNMENVIPSSNKDLVDNSGVKLYPNPASEFITFELEQQHEKILQIELFNVIGEKVLESSTTESIRIGHLSPGVYSYMLHFENSIMAGKLQIVR